jgi:hypothetical protein
MHHKFIPEYTMVSRVRYVEALVHLWEAVCQKHPEIRMAKHWVFVHENPLAPIAICATETVKYDDVMRHDTVLSESCLVQHLLCSVTE